MIIREMFDHLSETTKHAFDAISIAVVLGTIIQWLPSMAAAASLLWSLIRIYESQTGQAVVGWLRRKLRFNRD